MTSKEKLFEILGSDLAAKALVGALLFSDTIETRGVKFKGAHFVSAADLAWAKRVDKWKDVLDMLGDENLAAMALLNFRDEIEGKGTKSKTKERKTKADYHVVYDDPPDEAQEKWAREQDIFPELAGLMGDSWAVRALVAEARDRTKTKTKAHKRMDLKVAPGDAAELVHFVDGLNATRKQRERIRAETGVTPPVKQRGETDQEFVHRCREVHWRGYYSGSDESERAKVISKAMVKAATGGGPMEATKGVKKRKVMGEEEVDPEENAVKVARAEKAATDKTDEIEAARIATRRKAGRGIPQTQAEIQADLDKLRRGE